MSRLEVWGNQTTMNMENILHTNILSAHYFKDLYNLTSFQEVLHELKNEVKNLEPWACKQPRTPSTAFVLLYKFFTMRLTEKQMVQLIDDPHNQYVRAVGFLYLRYTCPPQDLWSWFGNYLEEESEIYVRGAKALPTTFGRYLAELLTEIKYFDTVFPRIPVPVQREIEKAMSQIPSLQKNNNRDNTRRKSSRSISPVDKKRSVSPRRNDRRRSPSPRRNDRRRSPSPRRNDRRRSPSPRRNDRRRSPSPRRNDRRRSPSPRGRRDDRYRDDRRRDDRKRRRSTSRDRRSPSPKKIKEEEKNTIIEKSASPEISAVPRTNLEDLKKMYGGGGSSSEAKSSSSYEAETIRIGGRR
ncbi:hypothetical protein PROFUN_00358 [Planoprotostelium fungivorum]|uniref:Pre-mRNA-splicing factor 38 n=1 Tax=Planoprotostelium fungivorum TaxID=1890364 RepID=A0A2P6NY57_9EUKA|nr:hypothetical protein PROFUN_00358 [Planoprotostelium fungivorum]